MKTLKEISKILKEKPSKISYYVNKGIVIPDINNPIGRGKVRRYSLNNMLDFLIVKELSKNGITLDTIKFVLSEIPNGVKTDITCGNLKTEIVLVINNPSSLTPDVEFFIPDVYCIGIAIIINLSRIWRRFTIL